MCGVIGSKKKKYMGQGGERMIRETHEPSKGGLRHKSWTSCQILSDVWKNSCFTHSFILHYLIQKALSTHDMCLSTWHLCLYRWQMGWATCLWISSGNSIVHPQKSFVLNPSLSASFLSERNSCLDGNGSAQERTRKINSWAIETAGEGFNTWGITATW